MTVTNDRQMPSDTKEEGDSTQEQSTYPLSFFTKNKSLIPLHYTKNKDLTPFLTSTFRKIMLLPAASDGVEVPLLQVPRLPSIVDTTM